jgi:hypothetical protein
LTFTHSVVTINIMPTMTLRRNWVTVTTLAFSVAAGVSAGDAKDLSLDNPLNPQASIYWCPNRTPDRQYAANPEPGCTPLVEKEEKDKAAAPGKKAIERAPIKAQDIQSEVSKFLEQARQFFACCASDPGSLGDLEELEDQASHLLRFMEQSGFLNIGTGQRGITLSQLVAPVARTRDDLRKLKKRLQSLDQAYEKMGTSDYETAGREQRQIQGEEASLQHEFKPSKLPQSAPTGTDIGAPGTTQGPPASTLPSRVGTTIEDTTLRNAFGADIGDVGSPGSDQRRDLRPRMGLGTQDTTLPTRSGTATGDTTLSNTTGFEIGTSQGPTGSSSLPSRAGPAIGDSSLNRR